LKPGHFAKDCPSKSKGILCYNCEKTGHIAKDCGESPKPRRPRGGARGFRGGNDRRDNYRSSRRRE